MVLVPGTAYPQDASTQHGRMLLDSRTFGRYRGCMDDSRRVGDGAEPSAGRADGIRTIRGDGNDGLLCVGAA